MATGQDLGHPLSKAQALVASLGKIRHHDRKSKVFARGSVAWTPPAHRDLGAPHKNKSKNRQEYHHEQDSEYLVMEAPLSVYPAQTNDETGHQHEPASLCYPAPEAL